MLSNLYQKLNAAITVRISHLASNYYWLVRFCEFKKRLICFDEDKKDREVCYVVGSGPSLRVEDLEKINGHFSISSNRIYHVFDKTSWRPHLYIVQDEACLKAQLLDQKFISVLDSGMHFAFPQFALAIAKVRESKARFYRLVNREFRLSSDGHVFFDGKTVTLTAIEMARFMGFKEIRLLGVDNSYHHLDTPQYFSPDINNIGINQPQVEHVAKNLGFLIGKYKLMNIKIKNYSSNSPLIIK